MEREKGMKTDTLKKANALQTEKEKIEYELDKWKTDILKVGDLGYNWPGRSFGQDHFVAIGGNVPESVFSAFRDAAMNALELRVIAIEKDFDNILCDI